MTDSGKSPFIIPLNECAPHIKMVHTNICSSSENIEKLKNWLQTSGPPKKIIEEAKAKTNCNSESCLYKKVDVLSVDDLEERFKKEGPWNSTAWLSNEDIDENVLEQWTKKFPRFKHITFQMRDFESRKSELARLNWLELAKEYDSLGCALNTDRTGGPGEHWTAFYVDFKNHTVEYFDSGGTTPLKEFSDFAINTADILSESGKKYTDEIVCKIEHQKENTECGVYTLYYILSRLHGVPFKAFEFKRVPDDMMVEFRKYLWRHS